MQAISADSTLLFVGTADHPRQVLRVVIPDLTGKAQISVRGLGVRGDVSTTQISTDVPLDVDAPVDAVIPLRVEVADATSRQTIDAELTVAEPGWTMHLISHFHYDPVWWATQAAYAVTWNDVDPDDMARRFQMSWQQPGFTLIDTHLQLARRDQHYKFVLAEVDLIKPYWDARPEQRAYLRQLVADGRVELLGGTYNEPNTNLTSAEVTIRNFVYGAGFQRDVFGADPATAWQLDVFGHDPQFPGLAADAGLSSSSWARGPFRPWGPMLHAYLPDEGESWGDPRGMQFESEFEWIAPSGNGVLTHYMPAHYSAGWILDRANTLAEAEAALLELFTKLRPVAATRNVLLPVGTDYTPPNRWITDIHRHWNDTYVWPRFACALPAEFFAAVRAEVDGSGRRLSPQTRDMNPIFTGKEVSFIDTKQAHRAAETTLVDAEKFAVFARANGAGYPHTALDKAWRHLVYGAHHDAVTGSESDQVYLDLLTNWHEALELATGIRDQALAFLCDLITVADCPHAVTVFNPSSWARDDIAEFRAELPAGAFPAAVLLDEAGESVPALVDVLDQHADGSLRTVAISFRADRVPGLGYRSWRLQPAAASSDDGWQPVTGIVIESQRYRVGVDPQHGGCVSSLVDLRHGRELIRAGGYGNALLRSEEYPEHPTFNEGPWHLLPTGQTATSADHPADSVRAESSALGARIVVEGRLGEVRYRQTLTAWNGVDRLDCRTELHGFTGADQLFRVKWAADIDGAVPVSEIGNAVIGRGHALIDVDSADHPWTLDNPAYGFCALSSTATVSVAGSDNTIRRAFNTAEIVGTGHRDLAVALVACGVTATSSHPDAERYGNLALDSNLPDIRLSVGGPADNAFTAQVLATAPAYADEFERQYREQGSARVWVPALTPLSQVWQPSADLRPVRALPVLVIAGPSAVEQLVEDLSDAHVEVSQQVPGNDGAPDLDDFSLGLINRGLPGFAIDTDGALHVSLMRSCTGWPSGVWIDPPARTAPDGSSFQQQHWSHTFDYSLAAGAGDWRAADLVRHAHDVNHPLIAHGHAGAGAQLPASGAFLVVDSDEPVVVTAVKATDTPLASGRLPIPGAAVSVRLYTASGRAARVSLHSSLGLGRGRLVDLLDRDTGVALDGGNGTIELALATGQIATVAADLGIAGAASDPVVIEPAQPIFARYWLNNTGTAPLGNLPVAVHLTESSLVADGPFSVGVTVASSLQEADTEGTVRIGLPPGWTADPADREYVLGPDSYVRFDVRVTPPADAAAGCYLISAAIEHDGQRVHDLCRVLIGGAPIEQVRAELLQPRVVVAAGSSATITARVSADAASELPAQLQLITAWDAWPWVRDWNIGAVVPARGGVDIDFEVEVPLGTPTGRWWAIVKVAAAGRVHFTSAIDLTVQ